MIRLTLEYCGTGFSGWQRQDNAELRTIQGEVERALQIYFAGLWKTLRRGAELPFGVVDITGSGRTDAGVHAMGQVASFRWPEELPSDLYRLKGALNGILPKEIVVRSVEQAAEDFDARHTPHEKCYCYRLLLRTEPGGMYRDRAWAVGNLDIPAMIRAARVLIGQHDFAAFRAADCTAKHTVRTLLRSEVVRASTDELHYLAHGKGFLKQMIRIIVGTLVEIGNGRRSEHEMQQILESRKRELAGQTAPAHGLTMEWVKYDD